MRVQKPKIWCNGHFERSGHLPLISVWLWSLTRGKGHWQTACSHSDCSMACCLLRWSHLAPF